MERPESGRKIFQLFATRFVSKTRVLRLSSEAWREIEFLLMQWVEFGWL